MSGRSLDVFWCTAIEKWTSFENSILAVHITANILSLSKGRQIVSHCVIEIWSWGFYHCDQHQKSFQIMSYKWLLMTVTFLPKIALKQRLYIYNPWFFMNLGQNSTHSKIDIIWKLYSCWSQWFKFQIHISFPARDTYHNSYPVYPVHEWE